MLPDFSFKTLQFCSEVIQFKSATQSFRYKNI